MKPPKKTCHLSADRNREDIERIHTMLRVAINHIEKKTQSILLAPGGQAEESLDDVLTGLTKITALISKLIPIEKEIGEESVQDETLPEEAIDWDMLERYFRKKNIAEQ